MDALDRFDVVTEGVVVGALRLTIVRPRSAEDLIDEGDYARDERLPYWAELWPSAHVLAGHLAARDLRGRRVVELGCGVGLPSVVAALGRAEVLATDWYADALAFVQANAAAAGARVETLLVDWADPPARPPAAARGRPRRGRRRALRGAQRRRPGRPGPPHPGPRRRARRRRPPPPPRRPALLELLTRAGWSLTTDEVRHGGASTRAGRSSGSTV